MRAVGCSSSSQYVLTVESTTHPACTYVRSGQRTNARAHPSENDKRCASQTGKIESMDHLSAVQCCGETASGASCSTISMGASAVILGYTDVSRNRMPVGPNRMPGDVPPATRMTKEFCRMSPGTTRLESLAQVADDLSTVSQTL